jgi:1,2-diacylglycerol 3-alpha-glucosyltransferase
MRVALFTDSFTPQVNGIIDSVNALASSLCERGHGVRLFTIRVGSSAADRSYPFDISLYRSIKIPLAWDWSVAVPSGVFRDCQAFRPDVIHTHSWGSMGRRARAAANRLRVPLVGTCHTFVAESLLHNVKLNFQWAQQAIRRMQARYYNYCAIVTAPSEAMLKLLQLNGLRVPCRKISNIIDTDTFKVMAARGSIRRRLGIRGFTLLSCGRITKEKCLTHTLDGFRAALRAGLRAELVVIGDGSDRRNVERAAAALGLCDTVRFTGFLPQAQIAEWMNASDAYVITSQAESQSLTMMQAMACGLPVIAVRTGGMPEYVRDGDNGLLVPFGDTLALAAAIRKMTDPSLGARLRAEALQIVENECSRSTVAGQMECAYTAALQHNSVSGGRRLRT